MLGLENIKLEPKCPMHDPMGEGDGEEKGMHVRWVRKDAI